MRIDGLRKEIKTLEGEEYRLNCIMAQRKSFLDEADQWRHMRDRLIVFLRDNYREEIVQGLHNSDLTESVIKYLRRERFCTAHHKDHAAQMLEVR